MAEGFRIISLRLQGNSVFEDLYVQFTDEQAEASPAAVPYTTFVIGPNGTGKSNLLRILILLFAELDELKRNKIADSKVDGLFALDFSINGNRYKYANQKLSAANALSRRTGVSRNDVRILWRDVELPDAVISLSNMLTDKFPTDIKDYPEYTYLGVRANQNTARTTSFTNRTIDLLYQSMDDQVVRENINEALKFIGYEPRLFVSYYPRYKPHFFSGELTDDKFEDFFVNFPNYTKRKATSPPWSQGVFLKLKKSNPEKIGELVRLCNKLSNHLIYEYEGSRTQYFEFDVFESFLDDSEVQLLKILHGLDIISYPGMAFSKHGKYVPVYSSSSGEYHFISGFIGLLACMKQNSLVLIDEPENSLHPNWQMKYISFVKRIFAKYASCHMILASHSHFMVSDLEKDSSTIVGLSKDEHITAAIIPANTYGWTAEEILLKIFNTPSTRNYYLAEQLGDIFELISRGEAERDMTQIRVKVGALKKLDLSGLSREDPLKEVITTLFEKFADA